MKLRQLACRSINATLVTLQLATLVQIRVTGHFVIRLPRDSLRLFLPIWKLILTEHVYE